MSAGLGSLARLTGIKPESQVYRRMRSLYWSYRSLTSPRTFSQCGEDAVLSTLLPGRGFYVDVGAGQPIRGSNTFSFYKRGWRGICIEPLTENVRDLRLIRRRDTIIQALCGDHPGSETIYEYDPYEYSTSDPDRVEALREDGIHPIAIQRIRTLRLLDLNLKTPIEPSLLSIDVEGKELNVLRGNDWAKFRPSVVCVEEWSPPLGRSSDISEFLADVGYRLDSVARISSIYVRQDYLKKRAT